MDARDVWVPIDALRALGTRLLTALQVPEEDAALVVDTLIEADLRGVESHGVAHLVDFYVRRIQAGHLNPRPAMRVVREGPAFAVLDADEGFGFVAAHRAIDLAMEKARQAGTAFVAVRRSTHYGAGFHYALKAARRGFIGISVTTGGNIVVPPGGRRRAYGSNVIAAAAPTGKGWEFVLDGATSVVAGGKYEIARRRGTRVHPSWGITEDGEPFEDPELFFAGRAGILPLGGRPETGAYKGFGYGILADVLSGVLSATGASALLPRTGAAAHCLAAVDIEAFLPRGGFLRHMDAFIDRLKATERLPGVQEITIPGEPEARLERERLARGEVPLHPSILDGFRAAAGELGVPYGLP